MLLLLLLLPHNLVFAGPQLEQLLVGQPLLIERLVQDRGVLAGLGRFQFLDGFEHGVLRFGKMLSRFGVLDLFRSRHRLLNRILLRLD